MPSHKMKAITAARRRVVFTGPIHSGTGEHDYVCGHCRSVILKCVDVRHPSAAAFECSGCGTVNVVARLERVPEEVAERFTRLYGDSDETHGADEPANTP
jgi:hypothetical protein